MIGLAVALGLTLLIRLDPTFRDIGVPVGLIALGLFALLAEIVGFHSSAEEFPSIKFLRQGDEDAAYLLVPMVGVEGRVNSSSGGYQRFLRISDYPGRSSKIARLPIESPRLVGRVVLVSLFIGRDGQEWNDKEVARGLEAVERAARWIEREAVRHAVGVRIGLAETYFQVFDDEVDPVEVSFADEGQDIGPMEARASTKAITTTSRAASRLGFADAVDLIGQINPRIDADSKAWMIHVRRSGRSLAILSTESDVEGVGLAVCYSRESSFPEPLKGAGRVDSTTVAHEVLHLFNATDKYGVALATFPKGSVTSKDVMRLNHNQLTRMTIDRLTAQEIGWTGGAPTRNPSKKRPPPIGRIDGGRGN